MSYGNLEANGYGLNLDLLTIRTNHVLHLGGEVKK